MLFIFISVAAATLNRLSYSRDHPERRQRQTTFLYNNNFHNQSFTAIHGGPSQNILPNINLNIDANHKATNGIIGNTFNGNGVLFSRNISNGGPSYCSQGIETDLQQGWYYLCTIYTIIPLPSTHESCFSTKKVVAADSTSLPILTCQ